MSYPLREDLRCFFDVDYNNQQPRLHMEDCDGNFEIDKIIDDNLK